ncbi:BACON domain-containing protein [Niabella defluvii]|nr:BACON domain-containing protein [Niabella sp. I65]
MRKFFANYVIFILLIAACGKEKHAPTVATMLNIGLEKTTLAPRDTTFSVNISSNTDWEILPLPGWLTVDRKAGSNNGRITFKVNENKDDSIRTFSVTVKAKDVNRKLLIDHMPYLKLKRAIGLPGNALNKIIDSVRLEFNQPVTLNSIRSTYNLCLSDIQYNYKDSNSTIQFSYACGAMGGEYPFTISAKSQFNETLTENIKAGFYTKRINLGGFSVGDFADYQENSYWLLLKNPHALYKIDMSSFEVLQKYSSRKSPECLRLVHIIIGFTWLIPWCPNSIL